MYIVNVLTKGKSGLLVDAKIIQAALPSPEFLVRTIYTDKPVALRFLDRIRSRLRRFFCGGRTVINLHCEQITPRFLALADLNVLVPNQEWARPNTMKLTGRMDAIFCKSHYATDIYQPYGQAVFVGFSSPDCMDSSIAKDYDAFLHLAGKSMQKGTRSLARVWSRHPEWPVLNLISRRQGLLDGIDAANINLVANLPSAQLKAMQNRCGIHLCPSEAEGFGHSIGEGMSTGAVMLTTDAPPMNELVDASRGIPVAFDRRGEQGLGSNFYVDETALEQTIARIIAMEQHTKQQTSQAARAWFLDNQCTFAERLRTALRTLVAGTFADRHEYAVSKFSAGL